MIKDISFERLFDAVGRSEVMHIHFFCSECNAVVHCEWRCGRATDVDAFHELAVKSAVDLHVANCPPRRGAYRTALGLPLRIKPRM